MIEKVSVPLCSNVYSWLFHVMELLAAASLKYKYTACMIVLLGKKKTFYLPL